MSYKRFLFFGLLLWLLLAALKVVFLKYLNLDSPPYYWTFYLLTFILSVALSRRLGVINFLEAAFVAVLWFIGVVFWDYLIVYNVLRFPIFDYWQVWVSSGTMMLAIFFFHQKRHVEIRKQHGVNILKTMFKTTFGQIGSPKSHDDHSKPH